MIETQEIHWKRIGIEAAAVVASILLAFAIDAWWSSRSEQARTEELLRALEVEWASDLQRIDQTVDQSDKRKKALVRAVKFYYSEESSLTPEVAMDIYRTLLTGGGTYKPSLAAHTALLTYGLDRINDVRLRTAIAKWPSVLAESSPEDEGLREFIFSEVRPSLARVAHNLGQSWSDAEGDFNFRSMDLEPSQLPFAVFNDDNFIYVIRHWVYLLDDYQFNLETLHSALTENLALLEAR